MRIRPKLVLFSALIYAGSGVLMAVDSQAKPNLSEPNAQASATRKASLTLKIQVLPNGHAGEITVVHPSGYKELDAAAIKAARSWRYTPFRRNGVAVESYALQEFVLDPPTKLRGAKK